MACGSDQTTSTYVLTTFARVMNSGSKYAASQVFQENIILDWYGRTIAGKKNVLNFLFEEACLLNHNIIEVKNQENSSKTFAMQRAIQRFRGPSPHEKEEDDYDSGFNSASSDCSFSSTGSLTPCSKTTLSMSRLHVNEDSPSFRTPMNMRVPRALSPLIKPSMGLERLKLFDVPRNLQFVDAAGVVTFSSPDEGLPYSGGRSWAKHLHVQVGYYFQPTSIGESICFSFLVYNNEMPCRRNLSAIFDKCE